jgi:hypothetical protein
VLSMWETRTLGQYMQIINSSIDKMPE